MATIFLTRPPIVLDAGPCPGVYSSWEAVEAYLGKTLFEQYYGPKSFYGAEDLPQVCFGGGSLDIEEEEENRENDALARGLSCQRLFRKSLQRWKTRLSDN